MAPLQAAALWTALLILLLVVLSVRVMSARWRHRVSLGEGPGGEMTVLSRGFGNAAEYTPLMIGALILVASLGGSTIEVHLLGGLFFLGLSRLPGFRHRRSSCWGHIEVRLSRASGQAAGAGR